MRYENAAKTSNVWLRQRGAKVFIVAQHLGHYEETPYGGVAEGEWFSAPDGDGYECFDATLYPTWGTWTIERESVTDSHGLVRWEAEAYYLLGGAWVEIGGFGRRNIRVLSIERGEPAGFLAGHDWIAEETREQRAA